MCSFVYKNNFRLLRRGFLNMFPCLYLHPSLIYNNDFPSRFHPSCQQPAIMFGCVGFVSAVNRGGWICMVFFIIACCEWKKKWSLMLKREAPYHETSECFYRRGGGGGAFRVVFVLWLVEMLITTRPCILYTEYNWVIRLRALLWFVRFAVILLHLLRKTALI